LGLLWTATTVSSLGTSATTVILPLIAVSTLHASVFNVGVLAALGTSAWLLFGLPSGVWVDKVSRRSLLVVCDLARAAALASIPVAYALHVLTLIQLFLVAFAVGTASVFFGVAAQSFIPQVVEANRLLTANSRLQSSRTVATIAGPAIGGWLVQLLRAPAALMLDVSSYLISASCLSRIKGVGHGQPMAVKASMVQQVRQGVAYVWRSQTLRPLALMAASFNLWSTAIGALQIPFLVRTIHVEPGYAGMLMAIEAPGALLGSMLVGRLNGRFGNARTIAISVVAGPLAALLIPLTTRGAGIILFALGAAVLALFTVVSSIVTRVYRQATVAPELISRVTAVNRFISWGVMPIGGLLAGSLSTVVGIRAALLCLAIGMAVLTPLAFFASPLRGTRDLGPAEPAQSPQRAGSKTY